MCHLNKTYIFSMCLLYYLYTNAIQVTSPVASHCNSDISFRFSDWIPSLSSFAGCFNVQRMCVRLADLIILGSSSSSAIFFMSGQRRGWTRQLLTVRLYDGFPQLTTDRPSIDWLSLSNRWLVYDEIWECLFVIYRSSSFGFRERN